MIDLYNLKIKYEFCHVNKLYYKRYGDDLVEIEIKENGAGVNPKTGTITIQLLPDYIMNVRNKGKVIYKKIVSALDIENEVFIYHRGKKIDKILDNG